MTDLPFDHQSIISYNQTVGQLRAFASTYASLESTSLVFGYGLDLFYIRVTPSQTFDLLSPDFNYSFLAATVSFVAISIVFVYRAAKNKELKQAWQ